MTTAYPKQSPTPPAFVHLTLERRPGNIFIITLRKPPENRLNLAFCQEIIRAYHWIHALLTFPALASTPPPQHPLALTASPLPPSRIDTASASISTSRQTAIASTGSGPGSKNKSETATPLPPAAVITTSFSQKFWCTGLELDESDTNPFANSDGFYPMMATILDFPWPTIAVITGHCFGGGCPFALSHDYRVMNSERGFFSMPPVELGLHFPGIGSLPRLKLGPQTARKLLLEAHKFTGKEALAAGIVDAVADSHQALMQEAIGLAEKWKNKGRMGVYAILRAELWGEAGEKLRGASFRRGSEVGSRAVVKL